MKNPTAWQIDFEERERRYHPERFLARDMVSALRQTPTHSARPVAAAPEPKTARKVVALSLSDLDAQILTSKGLDEVVAGMLPARSVNILGGDSGLGKSPLLCQMAVCVAAGLPFLGHATKAAKVLIADYENDASLSGMLHAVATAVGAPASAFDNLTILQRPEQDEVIEAVKQIGARLVIVDSLRGLNPHAESTKGGDAPKLIGALQDVDACWLLLHHLRKQPADAPRPSLDLDNEPVLSWLENMSGSRALVNQTFTRLAVDRASKADLVLRGFYKGRGEFGPLYIKRILGDDDEPIGYAELTGIERLTINQLADYRKLNGTMTFGQVSEAVGHDQKANRLIKACKAAGLVQIVGKGKDRRYTFQG